MTCLAFILRALNKYPQQSYVICKKKSRKMKWKKNSNALILQAKFQLKMYFYSCSELLELVILGNHPLLTWASFWGGNCYQSLLCMIILNEFSIQRIVIVLNLDLNLLSNFHVKGHPTHTKQDCTYLLSEVTSTVTECKAGQQSKHPVLSGSPRPNTT